MLYYSNIYHLSAHICDEADVCIISLSKQETLRDGGDCYIFGLYLLFINLNILIL